MEGFSRCACLPRKELCPADVSGVYCGCVAYIYALSYKGPPLFRYPLPCPADPRTCRRPSHAPSRGTCGRLPECPLMACDCVRLWWNCHKSGNLCALLRKNAVIAAKSLCERNKICYLLCSCLFGSVFGAFILSAEGDSHLHRAGLLCVLIGPFHTVANVLL